MKNNLLMLIKYLYYSSLIALLIIYLFPGSIIGYLFYSDFSKQPNLIENPIGTSINHLFTFMYITTLATICNLKYKGIFTNIYFIFYMSVFLEASHFFIPNRAFEIFDLSANVFGVLIIYLFKKIIK
mgnify:FL=1